MIDRRTFLRSSAGAVTLGGMGAMIAPIFADTPIPINAELARLIETHRLARAAMEAQLDDVSCAERAFFQDKSDEALRQAMEDVRSIQSDLFTAEKAAFLALLSFPVSTLDELRTIITVGAATWWTHDTLTEDEGGALIAGIMAGRA